MNIRTRFGRWWPALRRHEELARKFDQRVRELAEMVLSGDGDTERRQATLAEAEILSKALSLSEESGVRRSVAVWAIGAILLIAMGIPAMWRTSRVTILVDVFVGEAEMTLTGPFRLGEKWEARQISAAGLSAANAVTEGFQPCKRQANDLKLLVQSLNPAKVIYLESVKMDGDGADLGKLTLRKDRRILRWELQHKPVALQISFSGLTKVEYCDAGRDVLTEAAETVYAKRLGTSPFPVSLEMIGEKPWMLSNIHATDVQFLRREPSDDGGPVRFASTIEKGEVQIVETGAKHSLSKGDFLVLGGLRAKRVAVSGSTENLHVTIEGEADECSAGPEGFVAGLKPRRLEYWAHTEFVRTYWPAAVGFIGLFLTGWRYLWRSS